MVPFETLSLFILRETTPEILGPWEELEFTAMGTILSIVFKFTNSRIGLVPRHLACASIQIEW